MITQLSQSTAALAKTKFAMDRNFVNIYTKFDELTIERCLFTAWEMMASNISPFATTPGSSHDGGHQKSDHYWSTSRTRSQAAVTERLWRAFSSCGGADFELLFRTTAETLQSVVKTSGLCGVDELIWSGMARRQYDRLEPFRRSRLYLSLSVQARVMKMVSNSTLLRLGDTATLNLSPTF